MQTSPPSNDQIAELCARLAAVERSNRRLRAAAPAFLLALGAVATMGVSALIPDTIAARSFRLVDAGGAERAALSAGDGGKAVLTLYDAGRPSLTMTLGGVAPFVVITDSAGHTVTTAPAATAPSGEPVPAKRGRIGFGAPPPGDGEKDDSFDWAD
jgi:hypothetical protein